MEWMLMPLRRYADFSGRSRRMEYWMFSLFLGLVAIAAMILVFAVAGGTGVFTGDAQEASPAFFLMLAPFGLFYMAILIPSIAVQVRRLHDRDMSGWWLLAFYVVGLVPVVGFLASIALLVLMCLPGTVGDNRFGRDPKEPANSVDVFN